MNILDKFHNWRRKRRWNKQYKTGRWDSLKSEIESKRYYQIIDFMKKYAVENPRILDLGCGDGVLNKRMDKFNFENFVGVDYSDVSIKKAKAENFPKSEFLVSDIVKYQPEQIFDVVVFNEVFYYIHENEKRNVLNRICKNLSDKAIIIVSIYREGLGVWEYFKENPKLKEIDFKRVTTEIEKTYWKIAVYKQS
ncbi:class I SAM-dependent methyltransferase [Aequorivita echinoideorum]|uniref:Class I SAM-dependent methyltransferase n=1 Tax=Aequorivita echinoideorum TaxID=1549647 RepID=A0ABS5S5K0_9FLAO|nr:class I SAM-dependent methyltransferase [Aequorivita echinoideorum]MBT0608495.1 class I SAM-dependent methyltransferase [Aequorivita echinoideorum]